MGNIISILDENIGGLKVIKSFNSENIVHDKFKNESNEYKKLLTSLLRRKDLSSPMSELLSTIVLVIIMWFGGKIVLDGNLLSPEMFIGYILIFSQIIPPAKSFTSSYYRLQKGSAAASRVNNLMKEKNNIINRKNPISINNINKGIFIKNVSFKYENNNILDNINIDIDRGKTIALIGESGSGKTTIADLCARFFDVSIGEIIIDNHNIKDINITNLRTMMGIVSQESILFNDSIYNNILIGKPSATKKEVENAAKIANAHEFIGQTENSYNTNIGDKGDKLSGGQKQRITIARAILKNPDFLILDEATSSLDKESEKLVQDALFKLMKNRTSLVIAHRLSTIKNADQIFVINGGKVIEKGNHNELSKSSKYYRNLINLEKMS